MPETISPIELASLSGYTPQRIRQLQADGVLPKVAKRGQMPLRESAAALIGHMRAKVEKYGESRADAQNRDQQAKATLSEIAVHEKLGNLVSGADIRFFMSDLFTTMGSTIRHHKDIPKGIALRVCEILSELRLSERADQFRATCPRCRIPIFDDLDGIDQHPEKTQN